MYYAVQILSEEHVRLHQHLRKSREVRELACVGGIDEEAVKHLQQIEDALKCIQQEERRRHEQNIAVKSE
jgi:hypothetical protein